MTSLPVASLEGSKTEPLVIFRLGEQRYGLRLSSVQQIIRLVEVTPLPHAPRTILGVINLRGEIIPVFDLRTRFGLPGREIQLSDHLLIAETPRRTVALGAEIVEGVEARALGDLTPTENISQGLDYLAGVGKLEDGLVFIHDPDTFLSASEAQTLEQALAPV